MDIRRLCYKTASLLGWFNAAAKGKLVQRYVRVAAQKHANKILNKVIK